MTPRENYYSLRRAYRLARHQDAKWQPDPMADRWIAADRIRPDTAGPILRALAPRLAEAITARPVPAVVAPGPLSRWYRHWYPRTGRYANMDLGKRVALRRALRALEVRRIEGRINPASAPLEAFNLALYDLDVRIEAGSLRIRAETDYLRHKIGVAH